MQIGGGNYTYSGDPSTSQRDAVRFLIGDTETDDALLTDEEIDWIIAQRSTENIYLPAADAADLAGNKFSRTISRDPGTLRLSRQSAANLNPFTERATMLRRMANEYKITAQAANADLASAIQAGRRVPLFWLGMDKNPPTSYHDSPDERARGLPPAYGGPGTW